MNRKTKIVAALALVVVILVLATGWSVLAGDG
jgi:hypothetical protein